MKEKYYTVANLKPIFYKKSEKIKQRLKKS